MLTFLFFFIAACNLPLATPTSPPEDKPTLTPPQTVPTQLPALTGNADIIFTDGAILTMDDANPSAQAIAIQGNKILAVGANDEVNRHRGKNTILVGLEGKTLVPGFTDSHQHRILRGLERKFDLESTLDDAAKQGWTSLNELYVPPESMPQYIALARQDGFRLRVNMYPAFNGGYGEPLGDWYKDYKQDQVFSPKVRISGLKVFTDIDNAKTLLWTQDELNALLLARHQEGWHLAIKTVSTRSLEMILIALENIEKTDPNIVNRRVRLEHALFLTPEQIARVKRLGVIPSIQTNMPGELVGEQDIIELIAREPQGSAFPWRSLVAAGIVIANGSAYPSYYVDEPTGAPFGSPVRLIYQAVTRAGNLGVQPEAWMLNQTITAEQALRALTINAAYANFQDDVLGSLTPGKLADMVILSDNPLTVSTPEINNIQVLMTMIGGKVEHCAAGFESLCPSASNPPPAGEEDPFIGTWYAIDAADGSNMSLQITRANGVYNVLFVDEKARACGTDEAGNPKFAAELSASGTVNGNVLSVTFPSIRCLSDPPSTLERAFSIDYTYQGATDTLVDNGDGTVWKRR